MPAGNFPKLKLASVVCRKHSAILSQWPANGLPATFKDYASMYEVLLVQDPTAPVTSPDDQAAVWATPLASTNEGEDPAVTVQVEWPFIKPKRAELVDAVPLRAGGTALLYFCPVERAAAKEQSLDQTFCDEKQWPGSKWTRLSTVLGSLRPLGEPALQLTQDAAALFAALDAWLSETHVLPQTVVTLWRHSAAFRLKQVVRNPMRARGKSPAVALPRQYAVKNPLFNSGLAMFTAGTNFEDLHTNYADEYTAGEAQAVADAKLQRGPTSTNLGPKGPHRASRAASPAEARGPSWGQKYPMHKAAVMGDMGLVRNLIKEGQSPSLPDADKWTPLHYASWHGQTAVVGELMRDWQGGPMDLTDNGSSALHFAARNGYPDVVTILLACPIIKVDAEDNDKKTPLMLCESLQQGQWSEVAKILKDPNAQKAVNRFGSLNLADGDHVFHDFRIFVLDGTEKVIRLPDAIKTSQLRDGIAGMLQIPEDCYHLFAIWIKSPSLEIQLEDDMEPMDRIKRWPKMAELYTEPESWGEWRRLVFKRNQFTSLREERKTRSPVALKYLFEEALQMLICSWWPCSVDDAIFLAGLLMQIRYGDYNPTKHKTGYLSGDADHLKTFVPTHLFHNQLKNFEWERRIFEAHKAHVGKTDIHLLHRLFLQYCWQWPYYGATFFEAELPKARRAKNEPIRVGITCDWCCIILDPSLETMSLKASIAVDQTSHTFDEAKRTLLKIRCGDVSQASGLQQFLRGGPLDIINIVSLQATLMNRMFTSIRNLLKALDDDVRRKRMAQGGPRENRLVSQAPTAPAVDVAELKAYNMRSERERHKRYALLHSFGEQIGEEGKFAAQALFENRATCIDRYVPLQELNQIFMELGYWLGSQLESAREIFATGAGSGGEGQFNFRDIVSWWSQSGRSWLFLLDDQAFKQRQIATEIFLRNDPQRTGKIMGEKLTGVIRGLRSANMTKKTEAACQQGLDPNDYGVVQFNDYIDWLCHMRIITDREPIGLSA